MRLRYKDKLIEAFSSYGLVGFKTCPKRTNVKQSVMNTVLRKELSEIKKERLVKIRQVLKIDVLRAAGTDTSHPLS